MSLILDLLTGWLQFVSLIAMIGAAASRWFLLHGRDPSPRGDLGAMRTTTARLGAAAALAFGLALGLVFLRQLLEFRDPFVPWSEDAGLLLTGTPWGRTWILAAVATPLTLAAFLAAIRSRTGGWPAATLGALALGCFPAFTGHANAGDLSGLTRPADILHVWGAGAWIGALAVVLALEARRPGTGEGEPDSRLPFLVPRFSPVAMVGVGTLLATGAVASWVHLPEVASLWTTTYGRLLTGKVALACVVLALGALNFRRITPRLHEPSGPAAMRRTATAEFLLANVVLAVTALLTRTPPPPV